MNNVLSICIASYNKAEITYSHVKSILTCNSPEMEVVVVDNASPDDTVEQLHSIEDKRLRVIQNEDNIGGSKNLVKSLFAAEGKFCLYCNDRDIIFPEKLAAFIEFLKENPEVGGGHCVRNKIEGGGFIGTKGVDALLTINFRGEHPTGFFFRRELLDLIPKESVDKYTASEPYVPFPYENLLCEIICKGYTVGQYNEVLWYSTGEETHSKYVSGFVKIVKSGDRWFYPGNCLRRTIGNAEDTLRLCRENNIKLTEEELYRLYTHLIESQYRYGVFRYKEVYESPTLASHYAVKFKKVSRKELKACRQEMIQGFIHYVRGQNGPSIHEKYIKAALKNSDRRWIKYRIILFLLKVKRTLIREASR